MPILEEITEEGWANIVGDRVANGRRKGAEDVTSNESPKKDDTKKDKHGS